MIDDAAGYVAAHVGMFFRRRTYSAAEMAAQLVGEALMSGAVAVEAAQVDGWRVVRSESDWFEAPTALDWFHRIVPFTEGGPNASRVEALVMAFANEVITIGPTGGRQVVKGAGKGELPGVAIQSGGRVIAFR